MTPPNGQIPQPCVSTAARTPTVPRLATDVISFPSFHQKVIKVTMTPEGLWGKGLAVCHYCHRVFFVGYVEKIINRRRPHTAVQPRISCTGALLFPEGMIEIT